MVKFLFSDIVILRMTLVILRNRLVNSFLDVLKTPIRFVGRFRKKIQLYLQLLFEKLFDHIIMYFDNSWSPDMRCCQHLQIYPCFNNCISLKPTYSICLLPSAIFQFRASKVISYCTTYHPRHSHFLFFPQICRRNVN